MTRINRYLFFRAEVGKVRGTQAVWPKFQIVVEGDPFFIHCDSAKPPEWTLNLNAISHYRIENNSIYIQYSTFDHEGTYRCEGSYKDGLRFIEKAEVEMLG